jgi:hypothetical protein
LLFALALAWGETMDRWTLAHWDELAASEASLFTHIESGVSVFRRAFGAEPAADEPERVRTTRPRKK